MATTRSAVVCAHDSHSAHPHWFLLQVARVGPLCLVHRPRVTFIPFRPSGHFEKAPARHLTQGRLYAPQWGWPNAHRPHAKPWTLHANAKNAFESVQRTPLPLFRRNFGWQFPRTIHSQTTTTCAMRSITFGNTHRSQRTTCETPNRVGTNGREWRLQRSQKWGTWRGILRELDVQTI